MIDINKHNTNSWKIEKIGNNDYDSCKQIWFGLTSSTDWEVRNTFVGNRWSSKILLNMTHATYFKASKSFWEGNTRINSTSLVRQETKSTYLGSSILASTTQWISLIGQLQFSVIILRMQWIILQDLQAMTNWYWIFRPQRFLVSNNVFFHFGSSWGFLANSVASVEIEDS